MHAQTAGKSSPLSAHLQASCDGYTPFFCDRFTSLELASVLFRMTTQFDQPLPPAALTHQSSVSPQAKEQLASQTNVPTVSW
jgi:hypothetical protein